MLAMAGEIVLVVVAAVAGGVPSDSAFLAAMRSSIIFNKGLSGVPLTGLDDDEEEHIEEVTV
jgi:hypothetical protein